MPCWVDHDSNIVLGLERSKRRTGPLRPGNRSGEIVDSDVKVHLELLLAFD